MADFIFWQKWLFYSLIIFAAGAIILVIAPHLFVFKIYDAQLSKVLYGSEVYPVQVITFRDFILGPLGGTVAGFYILAAIVTANSFKNKEKWARNALTVSFAIWAFFDSASCIINKVFFQVYLLNLFSVLVKAIPLIMTWNAFETKKNC